MAQELKTTNAVLPKGQVKPQDPVKVYATDKTVYVKSGEAFEVHSALAEKLVASGKATKTAPKADKKEADKKEADPAE